MKIVKYIFSLCLLASSVLYAQNDDKAKLKLERKATDLVYEANTLVENDNFVSAEMEYRKALSKQDNNVAGTYNLAHSYYKNGNYDEALFRSQEAAKNATSKTEKHKAFHALGNILMQNKQCQQAVTAYKDALRNNPNDEETRYNFALAKECAEQQKQDGGGEDNKEDENKDKEKDKDKDKKQDDNKDEQDKKEDEGDKDKKKGEDQEDENGKPKDEKNDQGNGDKDKEQQKQKPKPQPGKMSPQQIKNILEAMNNQEQKVQEKMNAKKLKGAKVKTEKDW